MPNKATMVAVATTVVAVLLALAIAGLVNRNTQQKPFQL